MGSPMMVLSALNEKTENDTKSMDSKQGDLLLVAATELMCTLVNLSLIPPMEVDALSYLMNEALAIFNNAKKLLVEPKIELIKKMHDRIISELKSVEEKIDSRIKENIPYRLVENLRDAFSGSEHFVKLYLTETGYKETLFPNKSWAELVRIPDELKIIYDKNHDNTLKDILNYLGEFKNQVSRKETIPNASLLHAARAAICFANFYVDGIPSKCLELLYKSEFKQDTICADAQNVIDLLNKEIQHINELDKDDANEELLFIYNHAGYYTIEEAKSLFRDWMMLHSPLSFLKATVSYYKDFPNESKYAGDFFVDEAIFILQNVWQALPSGVNNELMKSEHFVSLSFLMNEVTEKTKEFFDHYIQQLNLITKLDFYAIKDASRVGSDVTDKPTQSPDSTVLGGKPNEFLAVISQGDAKVGTNGDTKAVDLTPSMQHMNVFSSGNTGSLSPATSDIGISANTSNIPAQITPLNSTAALSKRRKFRK